MPFRPVAPRSPDQRVPATEEAEALDIEALGFLAGDSELVSRFLALSGLDMGSLRAAAAQPGFLPGVLAFIAGHEKTLLAFAAASGKSPEAVGAANRALNPEAAADDS